MNPDTRAPAWLEAVAVFAAMSLTAVGLSAVFADYDWLPPVLLAVFLVVAVGAVFRGVPALRASGTAVIAQCVVGLLAVLVLCVPSTLALGVVPTGRSFIGVIDLLSTGVSDLYATTPPAPSTPGFTGMLVIAFTLITILIDGLVADLRAPKVSGVLLLVLWMIPVFFAPAQVMWWHVAAVLAAFLLLMLSPYFPSTRWRGGLTALVAGTIAVVIGLGVPTLLPQVPTIENRASGNQADLTVTNPFLDLRADLGNRDDTVLFDYTTTAENPSPIRLTSIDSFDGQTWAPTPFALDPFAIAAEGLPWPQGLPRDANHSEERIDVSIGEYDQQYLPTPYAPQQPAGLDRRWIYDEESLTIVGNGERTAGLEYSMDYLSVEPTAEALRSASPVDAGEFETELEVPASLPQSVRDTADEVTAGASNQWEAAVLLQAYFRSGEFEYSLDAPEKASGDAISDFLVDKKGYCVQFSSAMTIMARTMGIPARIGVGFASGDRSGDEYQVSMQDSHAWPELYFEGVGWVRFEPTPGGPAGAPPQWSVASGEGEESEESEETAAPTEEPSESGTESPAPESAAPSEEPTTAAVEATGAGYRPYLWSGLIAVAVILLLAVPALWRLLLRRRRLREPVDLEEVWREIRALATDYGQSLDPSRTLRHNELVLAGKAAAAGASDAAMGAGGAGSDPGGATAVGAGPANGPSASGPAGEVSAAGVGASPAGAGSGAPASDEFAALRSPVPTLVRPHGDTALASFIDALEAKRYGSRDEEFGSAEAHAVADEVRTSLSENATPGSRISAVVWPASIFNAPR
ncbi:transglutaminase-like putative cysteine protease [Brevibacterium sanguinis]|uniref:Transglutaminase-like putative cysteine protease n=2 Tax=Brevibacterium TaxID=1696 RepID=A0A366ICK9_9MICO|nr:MULTISPECIES: DUF3488 and transglutaminase-like domain-containing protein [Brevibacterium]RBP61920.1 transglutaminase-like putative cysteine protease [Brevibacterium sanguinis]RBP68634.1 transglutaminase-like putative cysteine protease [Brevibacterium celere]